MLKRINRKFEIQKVKKIKKYLSKRLSRRKYFLVFPMKTFNLQTFDEYLLISFAFISQKEQKKTRRRQF